MTANKKEYDIDDSAIFDARRSKFANAAELGLNPTSGIVYSWKCPEPFTEYCKTWYNSPILEITPNAFRDLGGKML